MASADPLENIANYIIIRWDVESGEVEMDLGNFNHYEAKGMLDDCLQALHDRGTAVRLRGKYVDEDEDEEEESET